MAESEQTTLEQSKIPQNVQTLIDQEAGAVLEDMLEFMDEETANYQAEFIKELRKSEYFALAWLEKTYKPDRILYPGSGSDQIPKIVFGEERVIHTSIEEYGEKIKEGGKIKYVGDKYFDNLGAGLKVTADNRKIPLVKASIDAIVLLESNAVEDEAQKAQFFRVLRQDGIIVLSKDFSTDLVEKDPDTEKRGYREYIQELFPGYEFLTAPDETQYSGENTDVEYYILKKSKTVPTS